MMKKYFISNSKTICCYVDNKTYKFVNGKWGITTSDSYRSYAKYICESESIVKVNSTLKQLIEKNISEKTKEIESAKARIEALEKEISALKEKSVEAPELIVTENEQKPKAPNPSLDVIDWTLSVFRNTKKGKLARHIPYQAHYWAMEDQYKAFFCVIYEKMKSFGRCSSLAYSKTGGIMFSIGEYAVNMRKDGTNVNIRLETAVRGRERIFKKSYTGNSTPRGILSDIGSFLKGDSSSSVLVLNKFVTISNKKPGNCGSSIKAQVYYIDRSGNTKLSPTISVYKIGAAKYYIPDEGMYLLNSLGVPCFKREWIEESILHVYGYNVSKNNGLSTNQRRQILKSVIDNHVVSKNFVINFLNGLIAGRRKNRRMEDACLKWESDVLWLENCLK